MVIQAHYCYVTKMIELIRAHLTEPTSRGIANAVADAIRAGLLKEGERLPAIRELAAGLQVSPTTVSAAWSLLGRAGSIRTDGRRGTTITAPPRVGPTRYRRTRELGTTFELDLSTGVPDPELLPDLAPSLNKVRLSTHPTDYLDEPMLAELLAVVRDDWPYDAARFTVMDGAMDAIDQICSVLLRFGDMVAVEQPGFPPLLDLLEAHGMRLVPVSFDEHGPVPAAVLDAINLGVSTVMLQPRAQNPTGISLSTARARELAMLLKDTNVLVVEDDSAGSVAASPALSLGRWIPEQVIHVRSYSKSHGPDLRLAAVSGTAEQIDALVERRHLGQGWTSRLLQLLLLDLLTRPAATAQVAHAREMYAQRRSAVTDALERQGIEVRGTDGLNIWLPVRDESAALIRLASVGIGAAAGAPFVLTPGGAAHLRVTTALAARDHDLIAKHLAEAAVVGTQSSPR